jgi:hypothetical protein
VLVVVLVVVVMPVAFVVLVLLVVEEMLSGVMNVHSEQPVQYQFAQATCHPPCILLHTAA